LTPSASPSLAPDALSYAHYVDADINPDAIAAWSDTRNQTRDLWYPAGHTHLEGEEVQVVADSAYLGTETVTGGDVTLDDGATHDHVGLAYCSTLIPMKLDLERMGIAWTKSIVQSIVSFYRTLGGEYGDTEVDTWPIIFRDRDDEFGTSPGLHTQTKELPYNTDYQREGDVFIRQCQPFPMTVRGIILPVGVYDDDR
jgi:hypothetical protein